jgi:nickel/cobalt transporter (NicO) family protein
VNRQVGSPGARGVTARRVRWPLAVRRRLVRRLVVALVAGGALVLLSVVAAAAHPLGNFAANRYNGLVVAPGELRIDHVQDLAEIPTAQARQAIDSDRDGEPSAVELAAWARRTCARSAAELLLSVDTRQASAVTRSAKAELRAGQAGLPTLRLECGMVAELGRLRAGSRIELRDRAPVRPGWREITARGDRMTLLASDVARDSISQRLTIYPKDMLTAPPDQRQATLRVRPGGRALAEPAQRGSAVGNVLPRGADRFAEAFTGLVARRGLTPGFGAFAMVVAVALGALHALAPGHGKTIMAAYAASRGRRSRGEVLALAVTVTVTHTAGVLCLGLLVATDSTLAPAAAIPWLGVASGVLVAVTGVGLLRRSLRGAGHVHGADHDRGHGPGHVHGRGADHDQGHGHDHGHGPGHDHGHDAGQGHAHPHGCPASRGSVVLMGFAGGLVPSPSAVVVLVGAAALGHAWFGVGLVLAYGAGLALSLTLVGVLLAGSGQWLARRMQTARPRSAGGLLGRVPARSLPVGAAALVMALGVGLALRGLPAALG